MATARLEFLLLQYDAENPCVPIVAEETAGLNVQLVDSQCTGGAADGCLMTLDLGLSLEDKVLVVRHEDSPVSHGVAGSRLLVHTWGAWSTVRVAIMGMNEV